MFFENYKIRAEMIDYTMCMMFALHKADLGSIPSILYDSVCLSGVISEFRTRSTSECWQAWPQNYQKKIFHLEPEQHVDRYPSR